MTFGSERPYISVKFSPVGRSHSFLLPDLALDTPPASVPSEPLDDPALHSQSSPHEPRTFSPGSGVVVDTADGLAFGTVVRSIPQLVDRRKPADDAQPGVVRRATREDVVSASSSSSVSGTRIASAC